MRTIQTPVDMLPKFHKLLIFSFLFGKFAVAQMPFDSLRLIASAEVYFDIGESVIRSDADTTLKNFAKNLPDSARLSFRITAHTDAIGHQESNLQLSKARAQAVHNSLIILGLPDSLFQTEVFGENKPIANNNTKAGRQRNRRATVEVFSLIRMIRLNGRIFDPESSAGIESEVIVHTRSFRDTVLTDSSGNFESAVPIGENFGVDVFAPGYFFETQMQRAIVGKIEPLKIPLKPVRVGASIDLNNFYFVGGQAVLLSRSEPELPKLLKFMQINPFIQIEVAGHVNVPNRPPIDEQSTSFDLSLRRAKLVHDYLRDNGIEDIRLHYKGYGNWQMRYPKANSALQQSLNRRVEIKVVGINGK